MKLKDWDTLQLGLEDLEIIEMYHEEKSIGLMAGKLKELITTNIAVMAHNKKVSFLKIFFKNGTCYFTFLLKTIQIFSNYILFI